MQHDVIPWLNGFYSRSYSSYNPRSLMSQQMGKKLVGPLSSFDFVDLSPTDPAVVNFDVNLTEGKLLRHPKLNNLEGLLRLNENGGFHSK
jgi:hypothetical protein